MAQKHIYVRRDQRDASQHRCDRSSRMRAGGMRALIAMMGLKEIVVVHDTVIKRPNGHSMLLEKDLYPTKNKRVLLLPQVRR